MAIIGVVSIDGKREAGLMDRRMEMKEADDGVDGCGNAESN